MVRHVRSRIMFLVARLVPSLLGVLTTAVLTRLMDPAEYGLYALGLSIAFFLSEGAFEWLGLSIMRMARTADDEDAFFGTVMTCFVFIFGVSATAAMLIGLVEELRPYLFLIAASLAVTYVSAKVELKQRLQLAELNESQYFRTSVARGVLSMAMVCVAAYLIKSVPVILLALATGIFLATIVSPEPRLRIFRGRFDRNRFRDLTKFGLPLAISVGLATVVSSADKWMLQGLLGTREVGLFTAATLVSQVPIKALAGSIGPWSYSMAVQELEFQSHEAANQQLSRNFTILFGVLFPGAIGIVALSTNLSHLVVGSRYWDAAILLAPWLAATAVISSIRAFYVETAFQLGHRTLHLIWITVLALIIDVGVDFWLIPSIGLLGAAIGGLTASVVSTVAAVQASRFVFRLPFPGMETAKILASSGLMFLAIRGLEKYSGGLALTVQVSVGVAVYGLAIVGFNVMGARERASATMTVLRSRPSPLCRMFIRR
jgi:O-antigen/teichoic acid export membrane protein